MHVMYTGAGRPFSSFLLTSTEYKKLIAGYIGDTEATSATLVTGGWLRTGDICYIDEDGFLYVVDRLKELIKYKGYQVIIMYKYCIIQVFNLVLFIVL